MPVSRHSFRRVIGDIVHRHGTFHKHQKKLDRNSLIASDSLSSLQTYCERLHRCEKEVYKSLSYLEQVLTHHKLEILGNLITSLIENIFDIDSLLKGIFEQQSESFRTHLLTNVYSLLADLIEWSDKLLFSKRNDDDKYRKIVNDLIQAVKICISSSIQTRSDSIQSFQSINSLDDSSVLIYPSKREKRPVSSSASIISHSSQYTTNPSIRFLSTSEEQTNDERIQSIFDDINHIVENYTRELDDTLRGKSTIPLQNSLYHESQQSAKRQIAQAYMSLFDRYDQNEAEIFLRHTCFVSTPEQRFEDLFEQIHQHFPHTDLFTTNERDNSMKYLDQGENLSMDRLILHHDHYNDLFLESISHLLVFNLNEDPPLRGGSIDALIIRATSPDKKDFLYQEAFLTTYRTFLSPMELVDKLIQRYTFFAQIETKKKIARYAFSLLIRVIDEIDNELSEDLMKTLSNFVAILIRHGELQLGKLLRRKSFERYNKHQSHCEQSQTDIVLIQNLISSKRATLFDFHAREISEQLTLIDAELFAKIQLSEILYMSIEKGEEFSPNLATFTIHFNNISYWVRSRILEQNSPKQRENYFEKFLKILKHLRRLNNFNSYLAILSALDCGPLKRLHWSKNIIDTVSEHTGLIDSTGSFKNYREALNASVGQPCIPYIGLILSDLTFVHIGNSNNLQDDRIINFWKRWQQFTILHKLRYCRKWEYKFIRNDRILYFLNNFDDFMNEEAQWIQSEKIKPRQKANSYT